MTTTRLSASKNNTKWCQDCEDLKQEVDKLKADHALNYKTLKDKIISTDKLIKRYTAKSHDCDAQGRKLEETTKILDSYKRDCENLESQLKEALDELEPLRKNNQKYEKLCTQLEKKLEKKEVQFEAAQSAQKQYATAQKQLDRENEQLKNDTSLLNKKVKDMEIQLKRNESTMKKLQDEMDSKKSEIQKAKNESNRFKKQAENFQMRSKCWEEVLRENGLLSHGRRMLTKWRKERSKAVYMEEPSDSDSDGDDDVMFHNSDRLPSFPAEDQGGEDEESLVEKILAEMMHGNDGDMLEDLVMISPAVSPLPHSPSSEDEDESDADNEEFEDVAERLALDLLGDGTSKSTGRGKGRGKKSTTGRLKVVQSALGPQGVLEMQESLSDTEDGDEKLPFSRQDTGVKTRNQARSDDDVFKQPLPVSPHRSRKRRGMSLSTLDLKPINRLVNQRMTRSRSFPSGQSSPVLPTIEVDTETQPAEVTEKADTEIGRRKRKSSTTLSDSDNEDLTISRRSLRSSSTSSDEGSDQESPRLRRRSLRLTSEVLSPPSRLRKSPRAAESPNPRNTHGMPHTDKTSVEHQPPPPTRTLSTGFIHGFSLQTSTDIETCSDVCKDSIISPDDANSINSIKTSDKDNLSTLNSGANTTADNHYQDKSYMDVHKLNVADKETSNRISATESKNGSCNSSMQESIFADENNDSKTRHNTDDNLIRKKESPDKDSNSIENNASPHRDLKGNGKVLTRQDSIHSEKSGKCSESEAGDIMGDFIVPSDNEDSSHADEIFENQVQLEKNLDKERNGDVGAGIKASSAKHSVKKDRTSSDGQSCFCESLNDSASSHDVKSEETNCEGHLVESASNESYTYRTSQDIGNNTCFEKRSQNDSDTRASQVTDVSEAPVKTQHSDSDTVNRLKCKIVTDSSPVFMRLVNQGSTGFVPINRDDLLSPVTPHAYSPNLVAPSKGNDDERPARAESKSSSGSAEVQALVGDLVEGREAVDFDDTQEEYIGEAVAGNIEYSNLPFEEENGNEGGLPLAEAGHMMGGADQLPLAEAGHMMDDDMSDQQSVLSSLPPSLEGEDERISPVSSLSTSGSTHSVPLSPLPFSDTESIGDPISPLPPTPERGMVARTPTPIDGPRTSPKPSCSNQPCTPPTPNAPPNLPAKDKNPVKLLAIKNLQRRLSAEMQDDPQYQTFKPQGQTGVQLPKDQGHTAYNKKCRSQTTKGQTDIAHKVKKEIPKDQKPSPKVQEHSQMKVTGVRTRRKSSLDEKLSDLIGKKSIEKASKENIMNISNNNSSTVEKNERDSLEILEGPVQVRTFKRRISHMTKRASLDKEAPKSANSESTQVKTQATDSVATVTENEEESYTVSMRKMRRSRTAKRQVSEAENTTQHPAPVPPTPPEPLKKPRRMSENRELKAIKTELEYLVRLKSMDVRTVCERITVWPTAAPLLADQILKVLETKGVDLLTIMFMACTNMKDKSPRPPWKPIMAEHEIKVSQLILQLNSKVLPTLVDEFIKSICKFLCNCKDILVILSVCRVTAYILHELGEWQRLRVVLFDILTHICKAHASVAMAFAVVWPAPLAKSPAGTSVIMDMLEFTVMAKLSNHANSKVQQCLQILLGWQQVQMSLTEKAESLVSRLLQTDSQQEETAYACRLLLVGQEWEWTNNTLILSIIWPRLQLWVTGQTPSVSDTSIQHLLVILGYAAWHCPAEHMGSIEEVIRTFSTLANGLPQISLSEAIKKTSLESLLHLSPFSPMTVAVAAVNWVRGHHDDYCNDLQLQRKIKTFIEFYRSQLQAIDLSVFNL